jgi:hypothetical protein
MADAYTVFWAKARCDALRRSGDVDKPLHTLFGGPHTSEPSFRRATVQPGDMLYPITVRAGSLYVLGRVKVARILTLADYVFEREEVFAPYITEPPAWTLEPGRARLTSRYVQASQAFDRLRQARPEYRYLAPSCTEEALECVDGTPIRLNCAIAPDLLGRIRYRSRRAERDLSKYIRDGRLTSILGVQGIYRLSEETAREFDALL